MEQKPLKIFRPKLYKIILQGHKDSVVGLNAPNGVQGFKLHSLGKDGSVRFWNLAKKQIQHRQKIGDDINIDLCQFDGNIAYTVQKKTILTSWFMCTGQKINQYIGHKSQITIILKINMRVLLSGDSQGKLIFWDTCSGQSQFITQLKQEINLIQLISDGFIGILTNRRNISVWDIQNSLILYRLQFKSFLSSFHFYQDILIIATVQQKLQSYSITKLRSGKIQPIKQGHQFVGWIKKIILYQGWLIAMADSKSLYVFNYPQRQFFTSCPDVITCFQIADGLIFAGCIQSSIRTWDLKQLTQRKLDRRLMLSQDLMAHQYRKYLSKLKTKKHKRKK